MTDIQGLDDIKLLVDTFYGKVLKDKTIGYIFTEVAKINVQEHMPKMYTFWNASLFGAAGYKGNTVAKHIELNKKEALVDNQFDQWEKLFAETIDELFVGEMATLAKQRAKAMRFLIQFKIEKSKEPGFIQ